MCWKNTGKHPLLLRCGHSWCVLLHENRTTWRDSCRPHSSGQESNVQKQQQRGPCILRRFLLDLIGGSHGGHDVHFCRGSQINQEKILMSILRSCTCLGCERLEACVLEIFTWARSAFQDDVIDGDVAPDRWASGGFKHDLKTHVPLSDEQGQKIQWLRTFSLTSRSSSMTHRTFSLTSRSS